MPYKDLARQREYQNQWMKNRRLAWLAEHGPCVDCSGTEDLQVDHADASIKVTHRVWSWSKARRNAELAKCVVRCEPCHIKKTNESDEHASGENNGRSKLTGDLVRQIRGSSLSNREWARRTGVDESNIRRARSGETWQSIA